MSDPDREIWDGMLGFLRTQHPTLCRQWFEELEPLGVTAGAMFLRAHSIVHRDYLRRQCTEQFTDAAQTVTGRLLPVKFLGPEDEIDHSGSTHARSGFNGHRPTQASSQASTQQASTRSVQGSSASQGQFPQNQPSTRQTELAPTRDDANQPAEPIPLPDSLAINPDYDFTSFIVGPSNRYAHAASIAVASNPGHAYNPLFIHGDVGLGKTHLLQSICLRIREDNPGAIIHYLSCESFVSHFTEAIRAGQMAQFRHWFRDVDVLVLDDIHFLTSRQRSQEEFFHTFNTLYQANKQIVLSSDAPPEEIPDLEDRLVSRFKWGVVCEIEPPDYETRIMILKSKATQRSLELPDAVAEFVAARIETNIRELEGAVGKLQITSTVEQRPIDIELARLALGEPAEKSTSGPSIQAIIETVTEFFNVRVADLQSKRRQRSIAQPRQVCMYLARRHTRLSLEEIGGYFGGRDHTTVMHAVKTVDQRRSEDTSFDANIKSLEGKLANI